MTVVMIVIMVLMMGGIIAGGARAILHRRRRLSPNIAQVVIGAARRSHGAHGDPGDHRSPA